MPAGRRAPPSSAGKWRTVGAALQDWPHTFRLCLIVIAMNVPVGVIAWLITH